MYPNVILLLMEATNARYQGDSSRFAQSLRAIKKMGIIDQKLNNLIVVLTKALSVPRGKKWREKLDKKSRDIQEMGNSSSYQPLLAIKISFKLI